MTPFPQEPPSHLQRITTEESVDIVLWITGQEEGIFHESKAELEQISPRAQGTNLSIVLDHEKAALCSIP
ncbi:uncharacterized protein N7511_003056 [Penicillium nucicola]|uniref:uncharacterized protein n=1 Tax=Penicillium nucicola TaxID=1850975 RepID=UPI0025453CD1|nr:uncharacterized protein N7511_003056 [Penicillium nucicola]KAJ5771005.1 hypothetical protein N7511_003056 [Penicillium nucicola]